MNEIEVKIKTNIEQLIDVCVTPYTFIGGRFVGGVDAAKNCNLARMEAIKGFRDDPVYLPTEAKLFSGRYLYAGPLWNHFGHILVDCVHRLWAYDGHDAIVFTGVIGLRGVATERDLSFWPIPSTIESLMSIIGIKAPIIIVRENSRFNILDIPELGAFWKGGIKPFYSTHLANYQRKIESSIKKIAVSKKLYFPRTHLLSDGGIIGSSYFEETLADNGFEICRPETISLEQQFANLIFAEDIVFDEGSSVHLTEVFSKIKPRMYMFPRRPADQIFGAAFKARGCHLVTLANDSNILLMKDRNGNLVSPAAITYYHDPEQVHNALLDYGLVKVSFNRIRFEEMERADLALCRARDITLRDERRSILSRARRPV